MTITKDASLLGWEAHLKSHSTQGRWSPTDSPLQINLLELRVVRNVCSHFLSLIENKTIQILTDNVACMFYISRCGGAWSHSLCMETTWLWNWCIAHNIHLTVSCLFRSQYTTAVALSRNFALDHEWELGTQVLHNIFKQWGFPDIDLFATAHNTKWPQFCSRVGLGHHSLGNAFPIKWSAWLLYAFTPFLSWHECSSKSEQNRPKWSWLPPHGPEKRGFLAFSECQCAHHTLFLFSLTSCPRTRVRSYIRT